jgi:hypothetical protein
MFALAIELSVLSWFMASDYTFGIVILYLRSYRGELMCSRKGRQFLLQKSPFYHKDKDMIEGYFNIREIAHRRYKRGGHICVA